MADTYVDRLEVVHHDDGVTAFENVTYSSWNNQGRRGVTVYRDGVQIDEFPDVHTTNAYRGAELAAAL